MFWRGSQPLQLLDSAHHVAHIEDLPFQHGKPLSPTRGVGARSIVLVDHDSGLDSYSPDRQVFMATEDNGDRYDPNEIVDQTSQDELIADAPQEEDEARRNAGRRKNQRWQQRREEVATRARGRPVEPHDLNGNFAAEEDPIFIS